MELMELRCVAVGAIAVSTCKRTRRQTENMTTRNLTETKVPFTTIVRKMNFVCVNVRTIQ